MSEQYGIIGRGLNGWHAKSASCSSSGGTLADYLGEAADGALVYDAELADRRAFATLIISGPIVAPDLAPEAVDAFGSAGREATARMLPGLGGGFKTVASKAISDPTYSGLDRVGVAVYERLLRAVAGVRIGRVQNGAVAWEDKP